MNDELITYGIQTEKTELRAHVCVLARCVYVYETEVALETLRRGNYRMAAAYTGNVKTAEGYLIPPDRIPGCRRIEIPDSVMNTIDFSLTDTTSSKGSKAVNIIEWLLETGRFPLRIQPGIVGNVKMQMEGADIVISLYSRIQVKCDYKGGVGNGCTGNLFLQTSECNPTNSH